MKLQLKQNIIIFLMIPMSFAFLTGCSGLGSAYTEYPDDHKINLVVSATAKIHGLPTCKNLSQPGSTCSVSSTGEWADTGENDSVGKRKFSLTMEGLNNFDNYEFTYADTGYLVTATGIPAPQLSAPTNVRIDCIKLENQIYTLRVEMDTVSGTNIKYGASVFDYGQVYNGQYASYRMEPANVEPYGDTILYRFQSQGAKYTVGVTNGVNAAFATDDVSKLSVGACPTVAPPPFLITSAVASNGAVDVAWDRLSTSYGYTISYGTSPSALNTRMFPKVPSVRVGGLINGTTYYFKVSAINQFGETQSTNVVSATPSAPAGPPAFALTSITPGNAQATLAWASSAGAITYDVKYGTTSGSYTSTIPNVTSPYVISGLTNGTTYYFKVAAVNAGGTTNSTNELSVTPAAVPIAPTVLNATAYPSAFQIDLDWTDNAGDETEYKVERSTDGGTTFTEIANSLPADTMYYADTSVSASTTYHYRVRAANAGGNSTYTNTASATTYNGAPDAPTSFTAQTVGPQINLGWSDVAMDETGYEIQKGTASGIYDPTTISQPSGFGTMTYFDTAVTSGNTYYYRIRAVKTGYPASAWSSEVSASIP